MLHIQELVVPQASPALCNKKKRNKKVYFQQGHGHCLNIVK